MPENRQIQLTTFSADALQQRLPEFGELLHACVQAGASVGFILPFRQEEGEAFWRKKIIPGLQSGGLVLFVALQNGRIVGSVQLDHDTPPNQPHRAEVRKLLVHPDFRRQGLARALMIELELKARELGRTLLTLDTRTGDKAEPLYADLGYKTTGIIPDFCRDTIEDRLDPTTIMYKKL